MSKVISVQPIAFGHYSVELDSGYRVTIPRGEAPPKVGDEYEAKIHKTLSVSHSPAETPAEVPHAVDEEASQASAVEGLAALGPTAGENEV